jgi:hypothetical protein
MRGDTTTKEEEDPSKVSTLISVKNGEQELEVEVDSSLDSDGWPTQVRNKMTII